MKQEERINTFADEIWSWYARHRRSLPWRDMPIKNDTERAYRVLVSEIMLQQTQVSRVIIIFKRFLDQFPTVQDLAHSSNKDVIIAWKGMGYNSRALRLRDAARTIVDEYKGVFPKELSELLAIKGIGPYTASAIRNFAFNIPTPGIDTNIRRVIHRTFVGPESADGTFSTSDKKLLPLCDEILDMWIEAGHPGRDFFAALMDFGSLVQTKSSPKWDICPLTEKGIMKTTKKNFESRIMNIGKNQNGVTQNSKFNIQDSPKKEPGRMMGSRYIPNRIFRGRIVDALRENPKGLTLDSIGIEICIDWSKDQEEWLKSLITKLVHDQIIVSQGKRFVLAE